MRARPFVDQISHVIQRFTLHFPGFQARNGSQTSRFHHPQVPPVAPSDSPGFSSARASKVLEDLVACGPKYVGFSEQCGLQVLQRERFGSRAGP